MMGKGEILKPPHDVREQGEVFNPPESLGRSWEMTGKA